MLLRLTAEYAFQFLPMISVADPRIAKKGSAGGVWRLSPQWDCRGQRPTMGSEGRSPAEAEAYECFKMPPWKGAPMPRSATAIMASEEAHDIQTFCCRLSVCKRET